MAKTLGSLWGEVWIRSLLRAHLSSFFVCLINMPKKSFAAARGKSELLKKRSDGRREPKLQQDVSDSSDESSSDEEYNQLQTGVFKLKHDDSVEGSKAMDDSDDSDSSDEENESSDDESGRGRQPVASRVAGVSMLDQEVPMEQVRAKLEQEDDAYAAVKRLQK